MPPFPHRISLPGLLKSFMGAAAIVPLRESALRQARQGQGVLTPGNRPVFAASDNVLQEAFA